MGKIGIKVRFTIHFIYIIEVLGKMYFGVSMFTVLLQLNRNVKNMGIINEQ